MKSRKMLPIILIIAIFSFTQTSLVFAAQGKGNGRGMAPGLFKNQILSSNFSEEEAVELIIKNGRFLPPGILKEIILGLDLSEDSLEELEEAGILRGLPGGVLKEIYSGVDEDEDDEVEVKGYITDIDAEDKVIEIDNKDYHLPEEVEVEIDGEEADLKDLEVGMKVELEIEDEEAEIEAFRVEGVVAIEGSIEEIDLIGVYHITIDSEVYEISEAVEVLLDEKEAVLEDLEVGMLAEIKILDDKVVEIHAESMGFEMVEGNITALDLIGTYHIEIDKKEYQLSRNAQVVINGLARTLEDLEIGMSSTVEISEDTVVKVIVEFEME